MPNSPYIQVQQLPTHLPKWHSPLTSPSPFGDFKRILAEHGVNSRGWRLYLDYGDALFMPMV